MSNFAVVDQFLRYIPVFEVGTHTDSQGKTRDWTRAHLENMVEAFNKKTLSYVPIKLGHTSDEFNEKVAKALGVPEAVIAGESGVGAARLGEVIGLHLNSSLRADIKLSNDKVADLVKAGYFVSVSPEIKLNTDAEGNITPVLGALSFLGAQRPALSSNSAALLSDGSVADAVYTFEFPKPDEDADYFAGQLLPLLATSVRKATVIGRIFKNPTASTLGASSVVAVVLNRRTVKAIGRQTDVLGQVAEIGETGRRIEESRTRIREQKQKFQRDETEEPDLRPKPILSKAVARITARTRSAASGRVLPPRRRRTRRVGSAITFQPGASAIANPRETFSDFSQDAVILRRASKQRLLKVIRANKGAIILGSALGLGTHLITRPRKRSDSQFAAPNAGQRLARKLSVTEFLLRRRSKDKRKKRHK